MLYAVSECEVSGEGPIQSPPVCKRCESDVTRKRVAVKRDAHAVRGG